jgi:hypothetical protein
MQKILYSFLGFILILTGCASPINGRFAPPYQLAAFSQNFVSVKVFLEQDSHQKTFLLATFTPEKGYHLYSKDIPRQGVYGEGRPTLLELGPQSRMHAIGKLTASAEAEVSDMGTDALLVYPAGSVTLSLGVDLPQATGWYDDQLSLTYMACSQSTCRPPVIGKLVTVRVPGTN